MTTLSDVDTGNNRTPAAGAWASAAGGASGWGPIASLQRQGARLGGDGKRGGVVFQPECEPALQVRGHTPRVRARPSSAILQRSGVDDDGGGADDFDRGFGRAFSAGTQHRADLRTDRISLIQRECDFPAACPGGDRRLDRGAEGQRRALTGIDRVISTFCRLIWAWRQPAGACGSQGSLCPEGLSCPCTCRSTGCWRRSTWRSSRIHPE